jgi:hypothetical protein
MQSRDPALHRAAQRRYRQRLLERGGELARTDERDPFTDAVTAASEHLAKRYPSEYIQLLMAEFRARGLDFNKYIESHDIAAGSFS